MHYWKPCLLCGPSYFFYRSIQPSQGSGDDSCSRPDPKFPWLRLLDSSSPPTSAGKFLCLILPRPPLTVSLSPISLPPTFSSDPFAPMVPPLSSRVPSRSTRSGAARRAWRQPCLPSARCRPRPPSVEHQPHYRASLPARHQGTPQGAVSVGCLRLHVVRGRCRAPSPPQHADPSSLEIFL
jgi:hypothetical protein